MRRRALRRTPDRRPATSPGFRRNSARRAARQRTAAAAGTAPRRRLAPLSAAHSQSVRPARPPAEASAPRCLPARRWHCRRCRQRRRRREPSSPSAVPRLWVRLTLAQTRARHHRSHCSHPRARLWAARWRVLPRTRQVAAGRLARYAPALGCARRRGRPAAAAAAAARAEARAAAVAARAAPAAAMPVAAVACPPADVSLVTLRNAPGRARLRAVALRGRAAAMAAAGAAAALAAAGAAAALAAAGAAAALAAACAARPQKAAAGSHAAWGAESAASRPARLPLRAAPTAGRLARRHHHAHRFSRLRHSRRSHLARCQVRPHHEPRRFPPYRCRPCAARNRRPACRSRAQRTPRRPQRARAHPRGALARAVRRFAARARRRDAQRGWARRARALGPPRPAHRAGRRARPIPQCRRQPRRRCDCRAAAAAQQAASLCTRRPGRRCYGRPHRRHRHRRCARLHVGVRAHPHALTMPGQRAAPAGASCRPC